MNYQEKVQVLATGIYNELQVVLKSGLGEDAAIATLASKIEDMQSNITDTVKDRVADGVKGRYGNPIKIFFYLASIQKFAKQFIKEYKKLVELAGDIAMDANFKPQDTFTTMEAALKQLVLNAMDEKGL